MVGLSGSHSSARLHRRGLGACKRWGSGRPAFRSDHALLWAVFATTPRLMRMSGPRTTTSRKQDLKARVPRDAEAMKSRRQCTCKDLEEIVMGNSAVATCDATGALEQAEIRIAEVAREASGSTGGFRGERPKCLRQLHELERMASRPHRQRRNKRSAEKQGRFGVSGRQNEQSGRFETRGRLGRRSCP